MLLYFATPLPPLQISLAPTQDFPVSCFHSKCLLWASLLFRTNPTLPAPNAHAEYFYSQPRKNHAGLRTRSLPLNDFALHAAVFR